jgi:MFS family permease
MHSSDKSKSGILFTVLICGLGYFVDIYDLILFSVVRVESLTSIGVRLEDVLLVSESIMRSQMIGMLLGGILFGILADKRGRLSILLGSILLYSLMSIANAFVSSTSLYAVLRFFSGIGLAGELGVAVTLVAEVMPKASRGYGTTIVASMGILGAVWAFAVHTMFDWRPAYVVGGVMGLILLVMRVRVQESSMFRLSERALVRRGNMLMLFSPKRLLLYISCIAIGVPIWYIIGILVSFSPELSREGGSVGTVVAGQSIMWAYLGLAAGDLLSGLISQWLKSRRLSILFF